MIFLKKLLHGLLTPELYSANKYWSIRKKYEKTHGFVKKYYKNKWAKLMRDYGACIPLDAQLSQTCVFPHGICGIFVSEGAMIGENCVIFQQVTIGSNTIKGSRGYGAPKIDNNCYIGAGAKIIGNVTIGDNCRIGANCVVVDSVENNTTVVMPKPRLIHKSNNDNEWHSFSK